MTWGSSDQSIYTWRCQDRIDRGLESGVLGLCLEDPSSDPSMLAPREPADQRLQADPHPRRLNTSGKGSLPGMHSITPQHMV